jgi:hypothetical protein
LALNIDPTKARAGKWKAVEDIKLKDAVQTHVGMDWVAISALIPGRTKKQCKDRWHKVFDPSIDRVNTRTDRRTPDENIKLKTSDKNAWW